MKCSFVVVSLMLFCFCLCLDQSHLRVAAETIECEYKSTGWFYATERPYYWCEVKNVEIFGTGEHVHIDGVTGQHHVGKRNEQVQGIQIRKAPSMGKFPTGLATIFPNLIAIDLYDSNLREITSEDLRDFSQLKHLWLHYNRLTDIREGVFEHNKQLEVLLLYGNRIELMDTGSLNGLSKLRVLYLGENICSMDDVKTREEDEAVVKKIEAGECPPRATTTTQDPREVKIQELEAKLEALAARVNEQGTQIGTLKSERAKREEQFLGQK